MPLQPDIALQGRGVDIKPFDPVATLVQVAQLKNMQSQEQLRQLQMAQLGNQLGEYQRIQEPMAQLRALNQGGAPGPGMVAGPQLGTLPPGGGMPGPGMQPPQQGPPPAAGEPPGITQSPMLPAPGPQAAAPNAAPPNAGPMPQGAQASAGAPQAALQAAKHPDAQSFPDLEAMTQRFKLYRSLSAAGPNYGAPMAAHMMDLDGKELAMRKGLIELQAESAKRTNEVLAGVKDEAGFEEARRVTAMFSPQEAARMPQTYADPMTKPWLAYRQGLAQTEQQRVETRLKEAEEATKQFTAATERLKLGEIAIHEGATQNIPYFKYGAPGQAIGQGSGAPPGTIGGLPASAPSKAAMQPLQAAEGKQLEVLTTAGETGRSVHQALNEVERLIGEGIYEQSPTLGAALWTYKHGGAKGVLPGYDEATLDRTRRVRELGAQLKLAQGRLGSGVSDTEGSTYGRAAGDFETGATFGKMRESITSMRKIADQAISNANSAKAGLRTGAGIPLIAGQATGGTPPPQGARNTAVTSAQISALATRYGLPEAEIRQRLQAAGKQVQ